MLNQPSRDGPQALRVSLKAERQGATPAHESGAARVEEGPIGVAATIASADGGELTQDVQELQVLTETLARENANLQTIFDTAHIGLLLFAENGEITRVNHAAAQLVDSEVGKMLGRQPGNAFGCVHAFDSPKGCGHSEACPNCPIRSTFLRVLRTAREVRDVEASRKLVVSGEERDFHFSLSATPLELNGQRQVLLAITEITNRKRIEQDVRRSNRLLKGVLKAASEISIVATDSDGLIIVFNQGAERMLGYKADEMIGKQTPAAIHYEPEVVARGKELSEEFGCSVTGFRTFVAKPDREGAEQREWTYVRKDGSHIQVSLVVTAMRSPQSQITGYLGIAQDITERRRAEEALQHSKQELERSVQELERERRAALRLMDDANRAKERIREMSERDPLTDLLNRRAFRERLEQEWERASRYQHPFSCVLLDLDFFKRINDTHGHAAGDTTLKTVARLLAEGRRSSDILCRYGGEEFCVLLPETDEVAASDWADRIRLVISQATIQSGDSSLQVTASIGVAERQSTTSGPEELVHLADEALAVAKKSGRNRVIGSTSLEESMPEWSEDLQAVAPLDNAVACDVMSPIVFCPRRHDTVRDVADLFLQMRISSAPVVDESQQVIGIIAETDLMTRTAFGVGWEDPIQEVMRTDVVCYEEVTPLREIYEFLSRVSVPWLVVIDQGRPTGVISRATLLRWFRNCVAIRQEVGIDDRPTDSDGERERRRVGIIKTAEATEHRAALLRQRIARDDNDFVPCVVGEATKLQSLVNDLLGHCQGGAVP